MPKLTQKQIKLQRAEAKLNKVSKRSKQFYLRFDRQANRNMRYRTKIRIERGDKNYYGNNTGLLHKAVNLRHHIDGDVPSVTKYIKSISPDAAGGKIMKKTAQATNFAAHGAVHATVNTALGAETLAIKSADAVKQETVNKAKQKYTREAVDDYHRGTLAAARISYDVVKGTKQHLSLKKQHRLEKAKYRFKRAEKDLFVFQSYKPRTKDLKDKLKDAKKENNKHKQYFRKSSKTNLNKAMVLRRRQAYRQLKNELSHEKKELKINKKYRIKQTRNQKKITGLFNPGLIALRPVSYTAQRVKASAWQKAINEDSDNDVLHALDSAKRRIVQPAVQKISQPERLHKHQNKRDNTQVCHLQKKNGATKRLRFCVNMLLGTEIRALRFLRKTY